MGRWSWYGAAHSAMAGGFIAACMWMAGAKPPILTVVAVLAGIVSLLAPLQYWKGKLDTRAERIGGRDLNEAARRLSDDIKNRRAGIESRLRINEPYPIPVPWKPAPVGLVDDLRTQREIAAKFPGYTEEKSAQWISNLDGLAGQGTELADVLTRCPTKRLVILGEGGSGKTILVLLLQWELLERRAEEDPVPVIFPLADWKFMDQDLYLWMAERLALDHPLTRGTYLEREGRVTKASALLESGRILPILDGLDEIRPDSRYLALEKINRHLPRGQAVVLTSQTEAYRSAIRAGTGVEIRLTGAAGVEVQPIPAEMARQYLLRDAGGAGTDSAARWNSVSGLLGTLSPVGEALCTPLALFLCRSIYNVRYARQSETIPHPDSLCDLERFSSADAIKKYLYRAYIPAVYQFRERSTSKSRMTPQKAYRAHRAIARHMNSTLEGATEFRWWEFHRASTRTVSGASLALGALAFLFCYRSFSRASFVSALAISTIFGGWVWACARVSFRDSRRVPTVGLRWRWRFYLPPIGALAGYVMMATRYQMTKEYFAPGDQFGESIFVHRGPNLWIAVLWILCGAVVVTFVCGWVPRAAEETQPINPLASLRAERKSFLTTFCYWLFATAFLSILVIMPLMPRPAYLRVSTVDWIGVGLAISLVFGVVMGILVGAFMAFRRTAWGMFLIARPVKAIFAGTPIRLMRFLEDAHRLGVLRKVGPSYQFRHSEIQRGLLEED